MTESGSGGEARAMPVWTIRLALRLGDLSIGQGCLVVQRDLPDKYACGLDVAFWMS